MVFARVPFQPAACCAALCCALQVGSLLRDIQDAHIGPPVHEKMRVQLRGLLRKDDLEAWDHWLAMQSEWGRAK